MYLEIIYGYTAVFSTHPSLVALTFKLMTRHSFCEWEVEKLLRGVDLVLNLPKKKAWLLQVIKMEIENMDSAFNLYPGHLKTLYSEVRKNGQSCALANLVAPGTFLFLLGN